MRKAHHETFEMSEVDNYIIQLLRLNIMLMSVGILILIDIAGYTFYGFTMAVNGGIIVILFVTLLGFLHSAFGINVAEWVETRV